MATQTKPAATAPPYTPISDQMLDPRWWRKKIAWATVLVTFGSMVGACLTALGGQILTPGDSQRQVAARVGVVESTIAVQGKTIDSLRTGQTVQIRLICEAIRRLNPPGSIMPTECP